MPTPTVPGFDHAGTDYQNRTGAAFTFGAAPLMPVRPRSRSKSSTVVWGATGAISASFPLTVIRAVTMSGCTVTGSLISDVRRS